MTISIKPTASETTIQENGSDVFSIDSSGITMADGMTLPASALTGVFPEEMATQIQAVKDKYLKAGE